MASACKSITKLFNCDPSSTCVSCRHQVASESVHGEKLAAATLARCDACVEECKPCKCHDQDVTDTTTKLVDNHADAADCSVTHAVVNMIGMLIGLGQLSTPYALENGGWSSVFMLIGLGIICAYSSHLLGKCLDNNPKSRSYTDIGQHAFGTKGRVLAATFIYLEIFMALVSYTISLHDNINTAFAGTRLRLPFLDSFMSSSQLLTTIAVLVALPSLWLRDLSSISFLSSGGILMSIVIFLSVASTAAFGGVDANHTIPVIRISRIPAISGLYIFSYAGHIVFPNLYKSMKNPAKFTKVSIVSFAAVTSLYTALAFMGSKLFGPNVSSQITLSMPPDLVVTKIAIWATILTPMTKYALEFAPFAIQLEHSLPASMSTRNKTIIRGAIGSLLVLLILALALSVPYFEHVLGLTGSLVSVIICIVMPCTFYLKISWPNVSRFALVLNCVLVAFGILLGIIGTVSSSTSLVKNIEESQR